MSSRSDNRSLNPQTIERMVATVQPEWKVIDTSLAESGYMAVYHLSIENGATSREAILKASPDGERHGIDTEARLMHIIGEYTALPVPDVIGAVDVDDELPTPFFLMSTMSGEAIQKRDIGSIADTTLKRIAKETGRYLAELHSIKAVDSFGVVDYESSSPLRGRRPSGDLGQLTVTPPSKTWPEMSGGDDDPWPALFRKWAIDTLDRHERTRFSDLTPEIRTVMSNRIQSLSGPFTPVLGRIDHGLHNLLIDRETGELTAMLDWAFTLSVPPAYDFVHVERNLSTPLWSALPDTPNRQALVREAMLNGYQSTVEHFPDRFYEYQTLYRLLACSRSMVHLDHGLAFGEDEGPIDQAAGMLREEIQSLIETLPS